MFDQAIQDIIGLLILASGMLAVVLLLRWINSIMRNVARMFVNWTRIWSVETESAAAVNESHIAQFGVPVEAIDDESEELRGDLWTEIDWSVYDRPTYVRRHETGLSQAHDGVYVPDCDVSLVPDCDDSFLSEEMDVESGIPRAGDQVSAIDLIFVPQLDGRGNPVLAGE